MSNKGKTGTDEVSGDQLVKALGELEEKFLAKGGDDDSSGSESESEAASDDSDESMSKAKKHKKKMKKAVQSMPRSTRQATAPIEDGGEGDSADVEAMKSFRDQVSQNGNIRKSIDASPFLEGLVDGISEEVDGFRKALLHVQAQNESNVEDQQIFNKQLAKAVIALGNTLQETTEMLKSFSGRPAGVRKSLVNKAEVNERFSKGLTDGGQPSGVQGDEDAGGGEYEFSKAQVLAKGLEMMEAGKIPGLVITTYESTNFMEHKFQKAIYNELVKSAN